MKYNIIYMVKGCDDAFRADLSKAIKLKGGEVESHTVRLGKIPVLQTLSKFRRGDGAVLITGAYVEGAHITVELLNEFRKAVPDIEILIIINREDIGTTFLQKFLQEGYMLAITTEQATAAKLAQLIVDGREYIDAKRYYGFSNLDIKDSTSAFSFNTKETALTYMTRPIEEGEAYAERLKWVKEHSEKDVYIEVIRSLETHIKDEISRDEIYEAEFAQDFGTAKRLDEKGGVAIKRAVQEATESNDINEIEIKLKREISTAVSRAVKRVPIGVASTSDRLGSTHQAILIANFLAKNGYKVALIEDYRNENPAFDYIGEAYGKKMDSAGFFRLEKIDFYPDYNIENISFLSPKNYQFFVYDLGLLNENKLPDFRSCVKQILLCGSQAWNIQKLQEFFTFFETEEQRSQINYLFMSAPLQDRTGIKNKMHPLRKVYFGKYYPDCFSDVDDDDMCYDVFRDYVSNHEEDKQGLVGKIKSFFK
jgi:hypothetical protein